mmetsp:Transcript_5585/g.22056  ORF Transcript_5585/g.22056 Transcript_5585/m.22056 type:complete len:215 (-) Transcript_5585:807-1451(-)
MARRLNGLCMSGLPGSSSSSSSSVSSSSSSQLSAVGLGFKTPEGVRIALGGCPGATTALDDGMPCVGMTLFPAAMCFTSASVLALSSARRLSFSSLRALRSLSSLSSSSSLSDVFAGLASPKGLGLPHAGLDCAPIAPAWAERGARLSLGLIDDAGDAVGSDVGGADEGGPEAIPCWSVDTGRTGGAEGMSGRTVTGRPRTTVPSLRSALRSNS